MTTTFRLSELLDRVGMSQHELARQSGVSIRTISRLATNATGTVALATLDRLAPVLGCQPGDLIGPKPGKRRGK